MKIEVIGLGAGDIKQLPLGIYEQLIQTDKPLYIRTEDHPVIKSLHEKGVVFQSFDSIYEKHDDFANVYEEIVETLLAEATKTDIVYAVPGHPLMAEQTVQLLLARDDCEVDILGGQSFLDPLFASLQIDPIDGFQLLDATSFQREDIQYNQQMIFVQVYDAYVASELKLTLLEDLPENHPVTVVEAAGSSLEKITTIPLVDLDRKIAVSNLTTLYVPPADEASLQHTFPYLRRIIRELRGENGCPWDKKQTHESLRKYALEEVYELIDAIHAEDDEGIIEELGDVLLQVMLHSQIGEDSGYFTIDDVILGITKKMIHRHPHVFAGETVNDEAEAKSRWEALKAIEKGNEVDASLLKHVTQSGAALHTAYELQKVAATVGFDWEAADGVWGKLYEEINEFKEAIQTGDVKQMEEELGDMLFVLANLAKWYQIHPEIALHGANKKFARRFRYVEKQVQQHGGDFSKIEDAQFEVFWQMAKEEENTCD